MVMLPAEGPKPMEKSKIEVKINEHYNLVRRTGLHRAEVLGKFLNSKFWTNVILVTLWW